MNSSIERRLAVVQKLFWAEKYIPRGCLLMFVFLLLLSAIHYLFNYRHHPTRPPISSVRNSQRKLAIGLESYYIDWRQYLQSELTPNNLVPGSKEYSLAVLPALSTPVPYIEEALLEDAFFPGAGEIIRYVSISSSDSVSAPLIRNSSITDEERDALFDQGFVLISAGPDQSYRLEEIASAAGRQPHQIKATDLRTFLVELIRNPQLYDPSNGTISDGDVLRTRKGIFTPPLLNAEADSTPSQTGIPASASLEYGDLQATGSHPAVPGAPPPLP